MAQNEITKLQQHLSLLKEEYTKLQTHCAELERKYNLAAASAGELNETSFIARLLSSVAALYGRETYSDIKVRLKTKLFPAHRLILGARSDKWNEEALKKVEELDWSNLDEHVAESMLRWIYTDGVDLSRSDDDLLQLMQTAHDNGLDGLVARCEKTLITRAGVRNCVRFYTAAETISAKALEEHCSALISAHWDDLTGHDFEHMSGPLLYKMLKAKTKYVLHAAIRLNREDVVFLFIVENNNKLGVVLNEWNTSNELPLDLALYTNQLSIAENLVQNSADVNIRDERGDPLLLRAIRRGDIPSATFLLEHGANVKLTSQNDYDTALHLVASTNQDSNRHDIQTFTEQIIAKGININAQNRQGYTALHISMMCRNEIVANILLNCADLDLNLKTFEDEHTALYFALLKDDDFTLAEKLVARGVTSNPIYSKTGDSLLHELARQGLANAGDFIAQRADNINHVNRNGETALHVACKHGPAKLVQSLLANNANPNALTNDGHGALHIAVLNNQDRCIEAFIEHNNRLSSDDTIKNKCDVNLKNKDGDTPLSVALREGFEELIPILVRGGGDVNMKNNNDLTLLHQAILKEDANTALFLIENGADIDATTGENETPLQLAVHCRLPSVVEALCVRGVDMGRLDAQGSPALWAALSTDQEDIASTLIRHGADPDCWGNGPGGCLQTLLHKAIDENMESSAVFLIQSGCDRDSPRRPGMNGEEPDEAKDGASPLHLCCQWGLEQVAQTLIEHGANVNARDAELKTPLHIAIENQHPTIISLLLCHPNIDLSLRDKNGLSPFATALTFRNNNAAQSILDRLPSAAEQVDSKGRNFLHTAIQKNDLESVLFLLAVQVDVNSRVQDSNLTPSIHLAARAGNEMLVRSLILAGARPDDRDAHKETALHAAADAGHAAIVSALLQNGADYDAVNADGDNALHIAVREGHLAVVRALLTESQINATAINLKGRNPLHELCRCAKDNAAAICELFLECMPDYPIDQPDLQGNTPLLLAYIKGNGPLCRVLVAAHACMGAENKDGITIFNYQVASKQLLQNLLDRLNQEAPWAEAEVCQECGSKFGFATRKHHCRHCGRCLCSRCSDQEVPILKFGLNKPARVCQVCFQVLQNGSSRFVQ